MIFYLSESKHCRCVKIGWKWLTNEWMSSCYVSFITESIWFNRLLTERALKLSEEALHCEKRLARSKTKSFTHPLVWPRFCPFQVGCTLDTQTCRLFFFFLLAERWVPPDVGRSVLQNSSLHAVSMKMLLKRLSKEATYFAIGWEPVFENRKN